MNGLRSALGFLTILPVAPPPTPPLRGGNESGGLAAARGWFPIVGLLLGVILAAADLLMHWGYPLFSDIYRPFPPLLSAAILVVLLVALTRALHLDGFMDCCDALLGGFSRERRLEILRDSHVGAFAVAGVVSLLLIKVAAIMALPPSGRMWVLLAFPCLSRWGMLLVLEVFPYARRQGIGIPFQPQGGRWQLLAGFAVTVIATVALTGLGGLALLAAATAAALGLGAWASKLLGGVTGDVYGAVNEVAEASALALAAVLAFAASDTFLEPIHRMVW